MSTLYIRLPSQAAAGDAPNMPALPCAFALVAHGKPQQEAVIEQHGAMLLQDMAGMIANAQQVVLLLAAADVSLLRVKVPPLSRARLKAALPNLVEDQVIGDAGNCAVVAGGVSGGLRSVAVVKRDWLEQLVKTVGALGARRIAALPAQSCLPCRHDGVVAAISELHDVIDVTLCLPERDGIGLTIAASGHRGEGRQSQEAPAYEVIRALRALVPEAPITLYVPQAEIAAFQMVVDNADGLAGVQEQHITVLADNWSRWIEGARNATPDLMAGLGASAAPGLDWRAWRWPMALAAAVMIINIAALNFDWWRKKTEADSLRVAMTRIFKSAYPKETVIIDPIAQMRQKIAAAKRDAGLPSPDDFTALAAAFGEACAIVMPGRTASAIAALEYRERSLFVQFKPDNEAPAQQLKTQLTERGLTFEQTASGAATVWQIRSAK